MVDPTTTNRSLFVPTRGSDVGTWDVPVNANATLLDTVVGAVQNVALTNVNVILNSTQYAYGTIRLTGNLSGNVTVTFPNVGGWWTVENQTSAPNGGFNVFLASAGGGNVIGVPPREVIDIQVNGSSGCSYRNFGRVSSYIDLAVTSVPGWITGSTVPPYLNCDGSTFSSSTYPGLFSILGGTTLPDLRGRSRFYLNGGTSRITTSGSGIDGNTILAAGGIENFTIGATNLPQLSVAITDPGHLHSVPPGQNINAGSGSAANSYNAPGFNPTTGSSTTGITAVANQGSPNTAIAKMPPATVSGLCLIRAA